MEKQQLKLEERELWLSYNEQRVAETFRKLQNYHRALGEHEKNLKIRKRHLDNYNEVILKTWIRLEKKKEALKTVRFWYEHQKKRKIEDVRRN